MKGRSVDEIARVRHVYERFAARYDRSVRFWERVLGLDDGRRWIASQAEGDVLEVGIGTGRKPALLSGERPGDRDRPVAGHAGGRSAPSPATMSHSGSVTRRRWISPTTDSTPSCSRSRSVRSRTTVEPWAKPVVCSGPEESSSCSNTSAVRSRSSATASDCLSRCPCASRPITCSETRSTTSKLSASRHKESSAHGGGS
jgi:hypothetical protein